MSITGRVREILGGRCLYETKQLAEPWRVSFGVGNSDSMWEQPDGKKPGYYSRYISGNNVCSTGYLVLVLGGLIPDNCVRNYAFTNDFQPHSPRFRLLASEDCLDGVCLRMIVVRRLENVASPLPAMDAMTAATTADEYHVARKQQ